MKKFLRWLDINFEPLCMTVTFYLMSAFYFCVAGILIYSLCGAECPTH